MEHLSEECSFKIGDEFSWEKASIKYGWPTFGTRINTLTTGCSVSTRGGILEIKVLAKLVVRRRPKYQFFSSHHYDTQSLK